MFVLALPLVVKLRCFKGLNKIHLISSVESCKKVRLLRDGVYHIDVKVLCLSSTPVRLLRDGVYHIDVKVYVYPQLL